MSLITSLKTFHFNDQECIFFKGRESKRTLNLESKGYYYPQSKNIETDSATYCVSREKSTHQHLLLREEMLTDRPSKRA